MKGVESSCPYSFSPEGEERVVSVDCSKCSSIPSLEYSPKCLKGIVAILRTIVDADRVVLTGPFVYEFSNAQTEMLKELASVLEESELLSGLVELDEACDDARKGECLSDRRGIINAVLEDTMQVDPIRAYEVLLENTKALRKEVRSEKLSQCRDCMSAFLEVLEELRGIFEKTELIRDYRRLYQLQGLPSSEVYGLLLTPLMRPDFSTTRILLRPSFRGRVVDKYTVETSQVTIFRAVDSPEYIYFLLPPEYDLRPEELTMIRTARERLASDVPGTLDFTSKPRLYFQRVSRKLLRDLATSQDLKVSRRNLARLTDIIVRYTTGYGVLETLLSDDRITDIYIDSPVAISPLRIVHGTYGECRSNIYLSKRDTDILVSRFRAYSARAFSESVPVLDLNLAEFGTRVAVIGPPLSPDGVAFALRRAKTKPWTLAQFVDNRMLTNTAAGFLSLLVDSQATMLVTGSRGAGKTSLLGALLCEIMSKQRIITIEDTLELPVTYLQGLGFEIQRMMVQAPIAKSETELTPADALRTALRLGESVIVVGEVRGTEARVLYEAMRVGAAGNAVLGTIHGSSTRDVFERIVYDLGIPPQSFKATDIVTVARPIRPLGSASRKRRLTSVSECRKDWFSADDENKFADLFTYNAQKDTLEPCEAFAAGESEVIRKISSTWGISEEDVLRIVDCRAQIKAKMVEVKRKYDLPQLLEAEYVVRANNAYYSIVDKQQEEYGEYDFAELMDEWTGWLDSLLKKDFL